MDWCCLQSYFLPFFLSSGWFFFQFFLYKFAFQVAAQRAFAEHVFALLFFKELGWNHDLSFFPPLFSCPQPTPYLEEKQSKALET